MKFTPGSFVAENRGSQEYNDQIKAFIDTIISQAFAEITHPESTPGGIVISVDIQQSCAVQGLAARMLDYIVQSLSGDEEVIDMIRTMRENLFEI